MTKKNRSALAVMLLLSAFVLHVAMGEVDIAWGGLLGALLTGGEVNELHATIVREVRLPRALTAMTTGAMLGWLGLLMQTWFRNPLAGPGVLGITSGGSLGVALAVLLGLALPAWLAAALGCFGVLLLIGMGARRFASPVTTLVFGLMISYAVSAIVTVLQSSATAEALQTFVFWGMGTFGKSNGLQAMFCVGLHVFLGNWMLRRAKWLDMWTLGDDLAQTMGVPKSRLHVEILLVTGLVLGVVTSVCGPLAFLGLATPHVYRFFHAKRGHLDSIRGIGVWGAVLALLADGVVRFTDSLAMHWPLNAVLAILGAPVVLAVLWKRTHDWS